MNQKQFLVAAALSKLREARELLAEADSPRALDKVRRAMKSTEGALRHAGRGDLFDDIPGAREALFKAGAS